MKIARLGFREKCLLSIVRCTCLASLAWSQEAWYVGRLNESKVPPMAVANLGGYEVGLVFDTGANRLYLHKSKGEGAEKSEKVRITDGKIIELSVGSASGLTLGGRIFIEQKPLVADMTVIREFIGVPCAGVFPAAILDDSSLSFDFDRRELKLFLGGFKASAAYDAYDLSFENRLPMIRAKVENVVVTFLIDTGSTACFSVTRTTVSELLRKNAVEIKAGQGRSVDASGLNEKIDGGWFLSGTLMGKNLKGVSFTVREEATIGMGWLMGFNFVLDLKNQKLFVQKRSNPLPPIPIELMTGAVFRYTLEGLIVERLKPGGGMAQDAGLELGDRLTSFGGSSLLGIDGHTFSELVRTCANSVVPFTVWKAGAKNPVNGTMRLQGVVSSWDFAGRPAAEPKE